MSKRRRTSIPRAVRARSLAPLLAAALAVAVAAVATLAAVEFLPLAPKQLAGTPRRPGGTPVATATPAAPTLAPVTSSTPSSTPAQRSRPRGQALVTLQLPPSQQAAASPLDQIARVLAVSADGELVASVERFGAAGPLHVTRRDGSDRRFQIGPEGTPAPVAAAFSPDDAWLAVVSGSGQVSRVDPQGAASLVSAGADGLVFGMSIAFAPDGRLLLTQVVSVELPLPSRIVALDPATRRVEVLSTQTSAYAPTPIDDGSVVFFATRADGTTEVRRLAGGHEEVVAALGATAWVDASRDGRHVAVERPGGEVAVVELASGRSSVIARGSRPNFSPLGDRLSLLDLTARQARTVDLGGRELSRVPSLLVAWAECPEGCVP